MTGRGDGELAEDPGPPDAPRRGGFSRLLAELAAAPRAPQRAAWDRGFRPGDVVAERFELVEPLGRGGFGVVLRARDRKLNRFVAFKAIPPGGQPDAQIEREAEVAANLEHQNLVRLYDYGRCESGAFLVFELLRGETLADRLRRGPLPVAEALRFAGQVTRALAHAHRQGVLHRDLKPANVFLSEDGHAKVLDFGLAYYFGAGPARSGTPGYMAPEQLRGEKEDPRTDVFAAGVLLREMLTGRRAPRSDSEDHPHPAGEHEARIAALVARATDPDPGRRPPGADALADELEQISSDLASDDGRGGGTGHARRGLLALALALLATATALVFWMLRPPPPGKATASLDAWSHYLRGMECADRPMHGADCGALFQRALELDRDFALAAWQLAVWASWNGRSRDEVRALLASAERLRDRLPDKEGALVRAWALHLDGRDADALSLLDEVGRRWPEDKQSFYQAGDILRHRDEPARAIPYFQRAVALEPDFPWALGGLAQSLGALGREDELRALSAGWAAAPGPGAAHALTLARGWLGDLDGAVEAARRAERAGGSLPAREDLLGALVFAGRYAEAEPEIAGLVAAASPVRRLGYYGLAALDAYRGRPRAGLARLDALARELPEVERDAVYHALRADYLLGLDDLAGVRAEVAATRRLDPALGAEHAVSLAWLGDVDEAEALARELPAGLPLARTTAALVRLRRGDAAGGLDALRRAAAELPVVAWRVAPLFLLGEQLARSGRDAEAVDVLRRAGTLYEPLSIWRSWAYPRGQVLAARSLARLGRTEEARATLDRLLASAPDPEPDCRWVAEARALRARLAVH